MAQLNDLIVNGNSRFLNTIHGTIENSEKVGGHDTPASGNAGTSQVVLGNDTRLSDARTPTPHSHGNIANGGAITSTAVTPANTDYLLMSDASNSGKIERGVAIGTDTTKYLRNDGSWATPSDTWRSIKINGTEKLTSAISSGAVDYINGTAITVGFNATGNKVSFTHNNSGVTASTYKSVTVDAQGHVTAGTNPTTLSGYGITDAKIENGTITLGSNTLTPAPAIHTHHDEDIVPLIHKKYESTSYYGTVNDWENTSWYFMSVKPDEWYKPWLVKLKVHTYCPYNNAYHSYTWSTICGRTDSISYANWNEKYSSAHTYIPFYLLKKAGFDAGYGHALGISIYNADQRTSSNYYRTFEVDYYECENCTVTILDTPVKWANWTGTGTTYYGAFNYCDATTRGLRETGDDNTTIENRIGYFSGKTGNKGVWNESLFMEDANGTYQNICTASDGTVTTSNRTSDTTKIANTNGFKVGSSIWYTNTAYNSNTNIAGYGVVYSSITTITTIYSFNTQLTANFLTPYAPLYLVGTIHNDGLFYLDSTWWTQTPNNSAKVYVLVGGVYDSTTSNCRVTLYEQNKWYKYDGTMLVEIANEAISADIAEKVKLYGAFLGENGLLLSSSSNPQADTKVYQTTRVTYDALNNRLICRSSDTIREIEIDPENSAILGVRTIGGKYINEYLSTEHYVGDWIDGSPIYEKTISETNMAYGGGMTYDTGISDMELLISSDCVITGDINIHPAVSSSGGYIRCQHTGSGVLKIGASGISINANANRTWNLTIRYTKSQ